MQVDSCYNSGLDTVCPVSVFRPSSHHHKLSHFVSLLPDAMSWPDGEEEERSGEGRGGEKRQEEGRRRGGERKVSLHTYSET